MTLTRRNMLAGGTALGAAAALPAVTAKTQPALYVRESIATQIRNQSPLIEAFRRGVDTMMRLPTYDKRNWWFQAYMYGVARDKIPPEMASSAERYFNKSASRNFFFLAWNRMHLYYLERILRAASGDPRFNIPYWAFEDPGQARVPAPLLPDANEAAVGSAGPYGRRNPLARAVRHAQIDRGTAGLRPDFARECDEALRLGAFTTHDRAEAQQTFGGVSVQNPAESAGIGGFEAVLNNVHDTMGLFGGDLGSILTAARDPLFYCIHANVDRLWNKWTNPTLAREPPVRDSYFVNTIFTFVDENGLDVRFTGAHILDAQYTLRYRYEDETPRPKEYVFGLVPQTRMPPASTSVLARTGEMRLFERDNRSVFSALPVLSMPVVQSAFFRLIVRDVIVRDRSSPYDVFLGAGSAPPVRVGTVALYGGGRELRWPDEGGATFSFDATPAIRQLARAVGASLTGLGVAVVRRGLADASGQELVSVDSSPPRIAAIELIQSDRA